jgi:hypothetical protein
LALRDAVRWVHALTAAQRTPPRAGGKPGGKRWTKIVHEGMFGWSEPQYMAASVPPDRFDDVRREWIAFHQGWSTIQRRRAEQLGRIVRKRQRIRTAAVPERILSAGCIPVK